MSIPCPGARRLEATVVVLGDHVNTDLLHPPAFYSRDAREAARGALAGLGVDLAAAGPGPYVLVAGRNLGCGSSRESTMRALQAAGVRALVARSFAHIFHRTALALGLWPLRSGESPAGLATGQRVTIDLDTARLTWSGGSLALEQPDAWEVAVMELGGLARRLDEGVDNWDGLATRAGKP